MILRASRNKLASMLKGKKLPFDDEALDTRSHHFLFALLTKEYLLKVAPASETSDLMDLIQE